MRGFDCVLPFWQGRFMNQDIAFLPVKPGQEDQLLQLIKELAEYEQLSHEVVATTQLLHHWIFVEKSVRAVFAVTQGQIIGYGMYFFNFSTFLGRGGLYLEDVYIRPQYRGRGFGTAFFAYLAQVAKQK